MTAPGDGMQVRPCTEDDLELARVLWPVPGDVAGAHYRQQLTGEATFLICWQDGRPLGWGLLRWAGCVGPQAGTAFPGCAELIHLQVREADRGRGAGTAILAAAERLVQQRGDSRLAVSAGLDSPDASRLYRRLGYRPTGVVDVSRYQWLDEQGTWHPEVESSELLIKQL